MMDDIGNRLEQLKSGWCDHETFSRIYGLDILSEEAKDIREVFEEWNDSFVEKRKCFCDNQTKINRLLFELFLQNYNLITSHLAGIQLAMSKEDIENVISTVQSMKRQSSIKNVIDASVFSNLKSYFPSLKFKLFSDRYVYIQRLHEAIHNELGIQIEPIRPFYPKKVEGKEDDGKFATEYDILTDIPFKSEEEVWLDFGKPIALKPDTCSIYTFVEHRAELEEYLFSPNCIDEEMINKAKNILRKN